MPSRPSVAIAEFSVSDREAGPYGITAGPDGALWFTMVHHGRIGRITPAGDATSYQLEPASSGPSIITAGPDEALWFTEFRSHRIGRITTTGNITSFPLPTPDAGPFGIIAGPDDALWFTEANADRIGRITTDGRPCRHSRARFSRWLAAQRGRGWRRDGRSRCRSR